VLGLNDRYWKYAYPSWVTGKLSDVCGLVVFPLLLWSSAQLAWRRQSPPRWLLDCTLIATGLTFSWIKLSHPAGAHYTALASSLLGVLHNLAASFGLPALFTSKAHHTVDPTDLLALPALLVARSIAQRAQSNSEPDPPEVGP
jgi:apolipoprotein N-acyltransferase